jgi:hypothetical protein
MQYYYIINGAENFLRDWEAFIQRNPENARVFYVPEETQLKVVVFYAGKHIQPAPTP